MPHATCRQNFRQFHAEWGEEDGLRNLTRFNLKRKART